MALWQRFLASNILPASRLTKDIDFRLHDMTLQMLQQVTPLLPHSIQATFRSQVHGPALQRLARKVEQRWRYLQQYYQSQPPMTRIQKEAHDKEAPPVTIVVLGGSVTAGINCLSGVQGASNSFCAWPARLESLLNQLAHSLMAGNHTRHTSSSNRHGKSDTPPPLVQVYSLATGGLNTKIATHLWQYQLVPPQVRRADLLIHAYATNDMHVSTAQSATEQNQTMYEAVWDMSQEFIRTVLRTTKSDCDNDPPPSSSLSSAHAPLLLWLDDYVGNEQNEIMATTTISQSLELLSHYYGFASISYANAVRNIVYSDTHETLFSPNWYQSTTTAKSDASARFVRDIHPGQGMHMAATWTVAYNLLNMATEYCSLESSPFPGLPPLRRTKQQVGNVQGDQAKPFPQHAMPPPLTPNLQLSQVSDLWRAEDERIKLSNEQLNKSSGSSCQNTTTCPFAWVTGFPVRNESLERFLKTKLVPSDIISMVDQYFAPHIKDKGGGWELATVKYKNKIGWVPTSPSAQEGKSSLVLEFVNLTQPISVVNCGVMKSYGPKWRDSKSRVEAWARRQGQKDGDWKLVGSRDLLGFHAKNTSEMYMEQLKLGNPVAPGHDLQIRFTLLSGSSSKFKLQGISVCSDPNDNQ